MKAGRRTRIGLALLALAGVSHLSMAREERDPADELVVTPLVAVAIGHRRATEFLASDARYAALARAAASAEKSVVRTQCRTGAGATELCERGTGVFVGREVVLTAGHLLKRADGTERVSIQLQDGTEVPARVLTRGGGLDGGPDDWALLSVREEGAHVGALPAQLPIGGPASAESVVVLGYTGDAGVGLNGIVQPNADGLALRPTLSVACVAERGGLLLEPVAGAIPSGGTSGGPIIDRRGVVVGIQVALTSKSVQTTVVEGEVETVHAPRITYEIAMCDIGQVRRVLQRELDQR